MNRSDREPIQELTDQQLQNQVQARFVPLEKQALKKDRPGSLLLVNQVQFQVSNQGRPTSLLIGKQFELHVVKHGCSTRILNEEEIKLHEVCSDQEDHDQPSVIQEDHDQTNGTQDDHKHDLLDGQNQSNVTQEHDDESTNVVEKNKMKLYKINNDQKLRVLPEGEVELHIISNIQTPRVSLTEEEKEQQMINEDNINRVTVKNEIEPHAINHELTGKIFAKEGIKEDVDFDQISSVEENENYQLHIIDYGVYGEEGPIENV